MHTDDAKDDFSRDVNLTAEWRVAPIADLRLPARREERHPDPSRQITLDPRVHLLSACLSHLVQMNWYWTANISKPAMYHTVPVSTKFMYQYPLVCSPPGGCQKQWKRLELRATSTNNWVNKGPEISSWSLLKN